MVATATDRRRNLDGPLSRIYIDNAATTHPKPPAVWSTYNRFAQEVGAPAGRASYSDATLIDEAIESTRRRVARHFGARPQHVVLAQNGTDALNTAIHGLLEPGDRVVTTQMEHNSVLRPLAALRDAGSIDLAIVPASPEGSVDPDDIRRACRQRTRLVVAVHVSNVCGSLLDVRAVSQVAHERGALFLLDAAQSAGSLMIDLETDGIDLLATPGHKSLLGPPGTGLLVLARELGLRPLRQGGTGTDSSSERQPAELPGRLEAGSPNGPAIAALGEGLRWIEQHGIGSIAKRHAEQRRRLLAGIAQLEGVQYFGPAAESRGAAVLSLRIDGFSPQELSAILDTSFDIQTRAGLHCAPGAHAALGTGTDGTVRLSPGVFTSDEDIDAVLAALRQVTRART